MADSLDYWRDRVTQMGRRAVFDKRHSEDDLSTVTSMQKREIYPVFRALLRPGYRVLVDFGCGYGRFSGDLADLLAGQVLALDPIAELLQLAPPHARVEYRLLDESGKVPIDAATVDVVWCCLVLGTIHQKDALTRTAQELTRILRPGGLCFIVENVAVKASSSGAYVKRSVAEVVTTFPGISLAPLHRYVDIDEPICVFGGYKQA